MPQGKSPTHAAFVREIEKISRQAATAGNSDSLLLELSSIRRQISALYGLFADQQEVQDAVEGDGTPVPSIANTTLALTNKSGSDVELGAVVIAASGTDLAFDTTTTAGDTAVIGVVYSDSPDGTSSAIANDEAGLICTHGHAVVLVDADAGAIVRGDWLKSYTTAGYACKANSMADTGVFAVALESKASGTGDIEAVVFTPFQKEWIRQETLTASDAATVTASEDIYSGDGIIGDCVIAVDFANGRYRFPNGMSAAFADHTGCSLTVSGGVVTNSNNDFSTASNQILLIYLPDSAYTESTLNAFRALAIALLQLATFSGVGAGDDGYVINAQTVTMAEALYAGMVAYGWAELRHEPTGFVNRTDSTITFTNATRVFSIQPNVVEEFQYYINGTVYSNAGETIEISDVTGKHFIYFDANGDLQETTDPEEWIEVAWVAFVYWNSTLGKGLLSDERHGLVMDWATHKYLHETVGVRFDNGLAGTFADTTFSIGAGEIHDEDIEHMIDAQTTCDVLYKDGSAAWTWLENQTKYYYDSSGLYYNNGTTLTAVPSNQYVAAWIFATPNVDRPIVAIIGQRIDVTLADARTNNTYDSLSLGTLPSPEMKILYRVLLRNDGTPYVETQDLRSISNLPAGTYTATDHGALAGLLDDDHTQYPLLAGRTGGQSLVGGTATAEDLTLTDNAVDGNSVTVSEINESLNDIYQELRALHQKYIEVGYDSDGAITGLSGAMLSCAAWRSSGKFSMLYHQRLGYSGGFLVSDVMSSVHRNGTDVSIISQAFEYASGLIDKIIKQVS